MVNAHRRSLRCSGVTFILDGADQPVLRGVDLEVRPGELVTLLGSNGSGKTSLCLLLAGVLEPSQGEITLNGMPSEAWEVTDVQLVQQPAEDGIVDPVVEGDVAFGLRHATRDPAGIAERVRRALDSSGLAGRETDAVSTLSGGETERLALAGAIAIEPRYLLVDEPTAHLDPTAAARACAELRALAGAGAGVVMVTHRTDEAFIADRVAVLRDGVIVRDGPPAEVLYDAALLAECDLAEPPIASLVAHLRAAGLSIPTNPSGLAGLLDLL